MVDFLRTYFYLYTDQRLLHNTKKSAKIFRTGIFNQTSDFALHAFSFIFIAFSFVLDGHL